MSAALTLDASGLDNLIAKFDNPAIREELSKIPGKKAVAAIVAQAIADNFDQEGPGWAPLKAATIRSSVSKALKKTLSNMSDSELLEHEKKARRKGTKESEAGPYRKILQKTRVLRGTVTTLVPGSSVTKNGVTGRNIWRTEGSNLIWGTDLVYAAIHNEGKGHIPQRKFLTIRSEWMKQLQDFIMKDAFRIIVEKILSGGP